LATGRPSISGTVNWDKHQATLYMYIPISSFDWFYLQPLTLVANWNKYMCTPVRPKDRRNQLKIKIEFFFMKCCFLSYHCEHQQFWSWTKMTHVLIYLIYLNRISIWIWENIQRVTQTTKLFMNVHCARVNYSCCSTFVSLVDYICIFVYLD
jgi:hypothetical protein